jgi:hypothetical protein
MCALYHIGIRCRGLLMPAFGTPISFNFKTFCGKLEALQSPL